MQLTLSSPDYPELLNRLNKPPECLYIEGCVELLKGPFISVVGSRDIQPWVKEWMENELLPVLKTLKIGVVSGGARGIDQWSHTLAVRAEVPTLVVLPSGLKTKYPQNINRFSGYPNLCFISEYEPDQEVRKHFFHRRNGLIAGLSLVTLIVQAGGRSGTMITAKASLELNNEVLTIPGNAGDQKFGGNNQLLYDGAGMVRDRFDLMDALGGLGFRTE